MTENVKVIQSHISQLEEELEAIDKNLVSPIKKRIEENKRKVHELTTPSVFSEAIIESLTNQMHNL